MCQINRHDYLNIIPINGQERRSQNNIILFILDFGISNNNEFFLIQNKVGNTGVRDERNSPLNAIMGGQNNYFCSVVIIFHHKSLSQTLEIGTLTDSGNLLFKILRKQVREVKLKNKEASV